MLQREDIVQCHFPKEMYQFFNTLHVPLLDNCPINKHRGRVNHNEDDDSEMLYKEDIFGSLGSLFDYSTSVSNSPLVGVPSSHGGLNDAGTSYLAGPEEVGTINNLPIDHVPCSPSPSNPNNADHGKSCPGRLEEVSIQTPIFDKVPTSPSPRVPSVLALPTQHFYTT
ncbi:hypothetical protein R1flu_024131 [Riccia fluitans]|uniref:Uncharacterized protein n=1 Tax=Riccia fluitans TaxID=41844 RepID=A0ABD1XU05_9MARC